MDGMRAIEAEGDSEERERERDRQGKSAKDESIKHAEGLPWAGSAAGARYALGPYNDFTAVCRTNGVSGAMVPPAREARQRAVYEPTAATRSE